MFFRSAVTRSVQMQRGTTLAVDGWLAVCRMGRRTASDRIGQLQPEVARRLEIREPPWMFEIAIDPSFRSEVPVFKEISKYPAIRRDLGVVVDEAVTLDELRESVNLAAKGLLRELVIFDVYRGKGIEPGRKSIALGLILQETSRTLTDQEADAVVAAVVARVKGDWKAGIRE